MVIDDSTTPPMHPCPRGCGRRIHVGFTWCGDCDGSPSGVDRVAHDPTEQFRVASQKMVESASGWADNIASGMRAVVASMDAYASAYQNEAHALRALEQRLDAALLDAATWALEANSRCIAEFSEWLLTREQWRTYVATIARLAPDERVEVPCPGDECTLTGHEFARDAMAWACFDHRKAAR